MCPAGHRSVEEYELEDAPEPGRGPLCQGNMRALPLAVPLPVKLDRRAGAYVLKADLVKVNIEGRRWAEATEEWRKRYAIRAGIEGTNSELKRATGLGACGCEGAVGCGLPSTSRRWRATSSGWSMHAWWRWKHGSAGGRDGTCCRSRVRAPLHNFHRAP